MKEIYEVVPKETACPMCNSKLASYAVLNGGDVDRHVGCGAEEGTCLLAKKSWSIKQWDDVCSLVASAGEGYPGAACDRMDLLHQLDTLVHTWSVYAELLSEVHPASPANAAFRKCAGELLFTLKEGKNPHARHD